MRRSYHAPAAASIAQARPSTGGNEVIVKSPIVGTYYDAPKPGDPPFVKVGDSVEPGPGAVHHRIDEAHE